MRKAKELRRRLLVGAFSLVLALGIFGIGFWMTGISGYAAAQATVTAPNGAKIRQDTSSTMVGGAEKGKVLNVLSEVQGSDGYTWYQVQVNDTTTGYIRSDLVEVTGEVAPTEGGEGEGGEGEGGETAPPVEVSQVNPVSATVFDDLTEIMDTASPERRLSRSQGMWTMQRMSDGTRRNMPRRGLRLPGSSFRSIWSWRRS